MTSSSIYNLAHMLDESRHTSYYDVFMEEHPEDKLQPLVKSLVKEFAESLKKDHINLEDCLSNGKANYNILGKMKDSIKHTYCWEKIPAAVYAAIISRTTALLARAKSNKFNENDIIQFDDVSRMPSRRVVEKCLDIMCHNTNVLSANTELMADPDAFADAFKANNIPAIPSRHEFRGVNVQYGVAAEMYAAWASYATGKYGEKYVCDSHNGPNALLKVLDGVEYSADTVELVVTLNKALDIVHARSDLAAAFIEGGQRTCSIVSNLPDKVVI